MRVLVGCEESQVVCKAFRDRGHIALSCDLQPARYKPTWHIQGDIIETLELNVDWDLIILHPDCTALALSGNRWYGKGMPMHHKRLESIGWTTGLWELAKSKAPRVALENPASVIFQHLHAHVQYIQPYQFGHMEQKKTGLALYNLPELVETDNVYEEMIKLPKNVRERLHYMPPGPNRKRDRSVTFQGIADAMADQWSNL